MVEVQLQPSASCGRLFFFEVKRRNPEAERDSRGRRQSRVNDEAKSGSPVSLLSLSERATDSPAESTRVQFASVKTQIPCKTVVQGAAKS